MDDRLTGFVDACRSLAQSGTSPGECVAAAAPWMLTLLRDGEQLLNEGQMRGDERSYARNAIYLAEHRDVSLFALVWNPGQWTPVHDHGTWGVVGVVRGILEERAFLAQAPITGDSGIRLAAGGLVLLPPGAVSTFVPNPDHIHMTGVPAGRPRAVSLHLYGRALNSFHVYDVAAGTRRLIDVPHYESR